MNKYQNFLELLKNIHSKKESVDQFVLCRRHEKAQRERRTGMGKWTEKTVKLTTNAGGIDDFVPALRLYKGKHKNQSEAPWAGKTFEDEYARRETGSEYQGGYVPSKVRDQNVTGFIRNPRVNPVFQRDCRRRAFDLNRSAAADYMNMPTYSRSYAEKVHAAQRPTNFRPGAWENRHFVYLPVSL